MSDTEKNLNQILIYDSSTGGVNVILEGDSVWLTLGQMAALFAVQKPAISKHLKNIFASGELKEDVVSSILEQTTQPWGIRRKSALEIKVKSDKPESRQRIQ